jgi:hypothetical protein
MEKEKNFSKSNFLYKGNLNLMIYLSRRKLSDRSRILCSMRATRLHKFLQFMNRVCFLDKPEIPTHFFLSVLSRCPFLELTHFLLSVDRENLFYILDENDEDDEQNRHDRDMVCFKFLKGLICLGNIQDARGFLFCRVSENYSDILNIYLIRKLIQETSEPDMAYEDRMRMFDFLCSGRQTLLWFFRTDHPDLSHSDAVQEMNRYMTDLSQKNSFNFVPLVVEDSGKVDIVSFVDRTFPLAEHGSFNGLECLICHMTFEISSVVRILPCCSARCTDPDDIKCVCEECLVVWGTQCNAENPSNRFERGTFLPCPYCRSPFPFPFFSQNP